MQYTAGQAAEATGKNITTITRAIKSGKISAKKDDGGAWRIDASELHRVFPLDKHNLRKTKKQEDASTQHDEKNKYAEALQEELARLRERVTAQSELLEERAEQIYDLKEDRDKWRQQAVNLLSNNASLSEQTKEKHRRWWHVRSYFKR